jgi:hypothetical protein
VNRKMAFLLCTPHVQWFHMNKNLTDWTLSSCALPLPSAKAHQPHVHATDRARAWDTTAAGITFALQLTSRNEPLLYSFPIARRQSPPPGIQTAFHHTGVGGRGRSPFIYYKISKWDKWWSPVVFWASAFFRFQITTFHWAEVPHSMM